MRLERISFSTIAGELGGKGDLPSKTSHSVSVNPPLSSPTPNVGRSSSPIARVLGTSASGLHVLETQIAKKLQTPKQNQGRPSHAANTFCQGKEK